MAILSNEPIPGFEDHPEDGVEEFYNRHNNLLSQLKAKSDSLPAGEYAGAVLSFPIGDGSALYLVQKTEPLTLQHIPYGDCYSIPAAHVRGMDLDDVKSMVSYKRHR